MCSWAVVLLAVIAIPIAHGYRVAPEGWSFSGFICTFHNDYNGYLFTRSGMTITPGAIDLHRIPTILLLCVASLATVLTSALSVSRVRDALSETEKELYLHTWHLKQLVPSAQEATDPDSQPIQG